ncbi:MAG TPA: FtsQ-type POTRA domain-containing protein [Terracidiphilus sp.]|nr:FtsQ-type POTRA domain-containing protein [Terracidiphilus sp.]
MESRFRRVQQSAPNAGRSLPGMPVEMEDPDGDGPPIGRKARYGAPGRPWWRPAGMFGRSLLACGILVVLTGVALALTAAHSFLVHDTRFRIAGTGNIQASGLGEVSRAEILPIFGEDIGRNIFFVPLSARRRQLEQIPWVQHATVMRLLPDQIRVTLVERRPVAFVRQGQQIGLVDASGVLLNMPIAMMAQHHYSFPVLTGIDAGDPLASRKARIDLYLRLMHDLDSTSQHYSEQISEIDLTDPEDARVRMPEQGTDILAHFGQDRFLERYQRYKAHIAEWRRQYPKLAAVDLRYDQQVVLQMAPGADANQVAANPVSAKPANAESAPPAKPAAAEHAAVKPTTTASAPKKDTAKVEAPKTPVRPLHASAPKPHTVSKTEKKHASTHASSARAKQNRAEMLAEKMRRERAARMKHATASKAKHKSAAKPHAAASAGHGR